MHAKQWFLTAAGLGAVLSAATVYAWRKAPSSQPARGAASSVAEVGSHSAVKLAHSAAARLGFGPEVEATLPAESSDGQTEILNLETREWFSSPGLKDFNGDARTLMSWIRKNGVNISGRVWPDGGAACVTYNMTVVPVPAKCWEEATAEDLRGIPVPALNQHSPRSLLALETGHPETYLFRTDQGTLGLLRLVGLSEDQRGVQISYKSVQAPGESGQSIMNK